MKTLRKMQDEGHIKLQDAAVASRAGEGEIIFSPYATGYNTGTAPSTTSPSQGVKSVPEPEIKQTRDKRGRATVAAGGVGLIIGTLLGGPVGGLAVGALIGALRDRGISNKFINDLSKRLKPDSSALFLLVESANADVVLKELKPFNATVIHTSLTPEVEKQLRAALKA